MKFIFRFYSSLIIFGIFLFNAEKIVWSYNVLIFLGIIFGITLLIHGFLTEFIVFLVSTREQIELTKLDHILVSTAIPIVLVLIVQILNLAAFEGDPDNTCMGMRDVGC